MAAAGWQFWIDRGGTFTDIVGAATRRASATLPRCCRENPGRYADAAIAGIATFCWHGRAAPAPRTR